MDIATPSTPGCVDSPSSANPSRAAVVKAAVPSTGRAEDSSLWRKILDTNGCQILDCASNEFLRLAVARGLQTIEARDLVNLLAKAERLGFTKADVISDNETDYETDQDIHETQGRAGTRLDATVPLTPLTPLTSPSSYMLMIHLALYSAHHKFC